MQLENVMEKPAASGSVAVLFCIVEEEQSMATFASQQEHLFSRFPHKSRRSWDGVEFLPAKHLSLVMEATG